MKNESSKYIKKPYFFRIATWRTKQRTSRSSRPNNNLKTVKARYSLLKSIIWQSGGVKKKWWTDFAMHILNFLIQYWLCKLKAGYDIFYYESSVPGSTGIRMILIQSFHSFLFCRILKILLIIYCVKNLNNHNCIKSCAQASHQQNCLTSKNQILGKND